jgi:hypothetical protein
MGSSLTDMQRLNVAPMIEQLATTANATGVTIYGITPRGANRRDAGTVDQQLPGAASVDFDETVQGL